MANSSTQEKIVAAFIDLLKKRSFAAIKVTDIVTAAGVSHMSFYRKYADKYALLEEICYEDSVAFTKIYGEDATWKDIVICILNCAKNHRQFYKKIYTDKEALECVVRATNRISLKHTGAIGSEYTMAVWRVALQSWGRNNLADPVESVYWAILSHLPACDILTAQEQEAYLRRYETYSCSDFRNIQAEE